MTSAYLIAAKRTPIGKFLGGLSRASAPQLGAAAMRAVLVDLAEKGFGTDDIGRVILGQVLTAGVGQAPARQAAREGGLPDAIPAFTVSMVCGSGLLAVMQAEQAIRSGDESRLVLAGGMESMSQAPHLVLGARSGLKFGDQTLVDSMLRDGLFCAKEQVGMGILADAVAAEHQVLRVAQDAFSAESHRRALAAREAGKFTAEISPWTDPAGKLPPILHDEGPRGDTTAEGLARLKPAFASTGTATAGNASQISDGAAILAVAPEALAAQVASPLKARIVSTALVGMAPKDLFIAPVAAVRAALARAGLTLDQIDLVEINEAFASQTLACLQELRISHDKVNIQGGAIALGHPIGASGGRILGTLLHALADRNLRYGLATLCIGGGNAAAMIVERTP